VIDHVTLRVSDFQASKAFYETVLAPLLQGDDLLSADPRKALEVRGGRRARTHGGRRGRPGQLADGSVTSRLRSRRTASSAGPTIRSWTPSTLNEAR
jgi:catechol 2,3-dioxygenase-like lactoylglutathione lyase family enzyme